MIIRKIANLIKILDIIIKEGYYIKIKFEEVLFYYVLLYGYKTKILTQ